MVTDGEDGTDGPAGGSAGDGGSDADRTLALIRELGHRAAVARGLRSDIQLRLLRSILDAAVALFNAAAASIALESDGELEFVVAAGEQGQGVVGRRVPAGQGLVGYVFQTGEPLALGDTSSDPRFGRQVAEQTGYVPRTILAVPLATGEETVGVLEVLDRRAGVFSGDDLGLASVFARQAALAIDATRVERDVGRLWARVLEAHDLHPDEAGQDAFAAAVADLDPGDDFWSLVDAVAREWSTSPERRAFVIELLHLVDRFRPTTRARPFAR